MPTLGIKLANYLKEIRFKKGRTQQWLADKANLSRATINRWETKGAGSATLDEIEMLASQLEVSTLDLLGLAEELNATRKAQIKALEQIESDPGPTLAKLNEAGPKLVPDSRLPLIGAIVTALTPLNDTKLELVLRLATRLAGGVDQSQNVSGSIESNKK